MRIRLLVVTALAAGSVSVSVPAWGLTDPEPGAVPKPPGLDIGWPIPAGERGRVTAGYGPYAGSSLHHYTDNPSYANDYYAMDVVYPDYPNNGLGQPVVAMASGTVVKAGWATAGWANYGLRVIIRLDFNADGHTYITHYAHLNAIYVAEGDHVDKGQPIGELGDSCDGDNQVLSCPYFGPHLHFAMHQDSSIGGSGTGGSYGGHAVVPEPIDGYEDIQPGLVFISQNSGGPTPPCALITPPETILEEDGPCFRRFGPPQYWHEEAVGHGGHSIWTYTIDDPEPDNYAMWMLFFDQAGDYELAAYVPAAFGESQRARYTIRHDGTVEQVVVSQASAPDDWLVLGTFRFGAGGDQWVKLEDNTGERYVDENNNTKIAFDALRIRPAQACECSADDPPQTQACERCGMQTRHCDGCRWPDWSTVPCENQGECEEGQVEREGCAEGGERYRTCGQDCTWGAWSECGAEVPDGGVQDTDGGVSEADGGPGSDTGPEDGGSVEGGCEGCRTGRAPISWPLVLLVLGLLLRRR